MVKKKSRENFEVKELQRRITKAERDGDDRSLSDAYVELGEVVLNQLKDIPSSLGYYRKAVEVSERIGAHENAAYAHRAIAEICCELKESKTALEHGKKYLEAALKCGVVHQIQLAYHVLAWLYFQVYLNSNSPNKTFLEKAKQWSEKSVRFLDKNASTIDCDREAVRKGDRSSVRRARLWQLMSNICDRLGLHTEKRKYLNAAMAHATRERDHFLLHRCLLTKLEFSGEQRVKTAVELVEAARNVSPTDHADARFILAQEKVRVKDFVGAKWDLMSLHFDKHFELFSADDQNALQQLLVVVYKTVERLKEVAELDDESKMRIYEKIADEFFEVEYRELSLDFYKKMLEFASSLRSQQMALVSIAETLKDLDRFEEAYEFYQKVDAVEALLNLSAKKRATTSICIANMAANAKCFPSDHVLRLFDRADELAVTTQQKRDLCELLLEYLKASNGDGERILETQKKLATLKEAMNDEMDMSEGGEDEEDSSGGDTSSPPTTDPCAFLTDIQILAKCRVESDQRSIEEQIRSEKDKKINVYGETRLHEAARGTSSDFVELLINAGYNVNARDEGGWTPLHEAISALKLQNVRLLVEHGANVDIRSKECTVTDTGQRTDSGGLTPLMEACDRGATAIAEVLLRNGANVALRNADGWTALDFLRNAIRTEMVNEEDLPTAQRLALSMENKLKAANVVVSDVPPPKKTIAKAVVRSGSRSFSDENAKLAELSVAKLSADERNLRDYRRTMRAVGRGDVHERDVLADFENDPFIDFQNAEPTAETTEMLEVDSELEQLLYGGDGLPEDNTVRPPSVVGPSRIASGDVTSPRARPVHLSRRSTVPDDDVFIMDDASASTSSRVSSASRKRCTSTQRHDSKQKYPWRRIIRECSSEDERSLSPPHLEAVMKEGVISDRDVSSTFISSQSSSQAGRLRPAVRQDTAVAAFRQDSVSELRRPSFVSEASMAPAHRPSDQLVLVKISFQRADGTPLKVKAIPFSSSATVADVRERCVRELQTAECASDGESLRICRRGCEVSDETPLALIFTDDDRSVECVVHRLIQLSAAQIYEKKSKRAQPGIVRALSSVPSDGRLNLSNTNLEKEADALTAALRALSTNDVREVRLDGTPVSAMLTDFMLSMMPTLETLSLSCCNLNCQILRKVFVREFEKLTTLDLSFNYLRDSPSDSATVPSLITRCSNLKSLRLASVVLNIAVVPELVREIKKLRCLEELDLSQNRYVQSEHASEILMSCKALKCFDVSATGVTRLLHSSGENFVNLERLSLALCDLDSEATWLHEFLSASGAQMTLLDLSVTSVSMECVETILKWKSTKLPRMRLRLQGCIEVEERLDELVTVLQSVVTTDIAIRVDVSPPFREQLLNTIAPEFAFCIECG